MNAMAAKATNLPQYKTCYLFPMAQHIAPLVYYSDRMTELLPIRMYVIEDVSPKQGHSHGSGRKVRPATIVPCYLTADVDEDELSHHAGYVVN